MKKEKCALDPSSNEMPCCSMNDEGRVTCENRDSLFLGLKGRFVEFLIIALAIMVVIIPLATVGVMSFFDTDLNVEGENIYQYDGMMEYMYRNGTKGHEETLSLDINPDSDGDYSEVEVSLGGSTVSAYTCNQTTGFLKDTNRYTIFWILVPNYLQSILSGEVFTGGVLGSEFDLIDPVGLIGGGNDTYTLEIVDRGGFLIGDSDIGGGQGSFEFIIYDDHDVKVGEGVVDATTGVLMHFDGNVELILDDAGAFPISKNRNAMIWIAIGTAIITPILAFVVIVLSQFLGFKYPKEEAEDIAILIALGGLAILMDLFMNVWFSSLFGFEYTILTSILALAVFAVACVKMNINIKWCFPALSEIALLLLFKIFAGIAFFAYASIAIMGFITTFIMLVFRRGLIKNDGLSDDIRRFTKNMGVKI
jgi:hypothetical protein